MRQQHDISAGVIVFFQENEACRFLLLLSRQTKRPLWEFPKGGVEPGETLLQAALRELQEETGLGPQEVRLVPGFEFLERYRFVIGRGRDRTLVQKRVTYFLAEAVHRTVRVSETETREHAWLDLEEALRRVRYRDRRRMLESAAHTAKCQAEPAASADENGPPKPQVRIDASDAGEPGK